MDVEARVVDVEMVLQPGDWVCQVIEGGALGRLARFRAFCDRNVL